MRESGRPGGGGEISGFNGHVLRSFFVMELPDLDRPIGARREQPPAVGRAGDRPDGVLMGGKARHKLFAHGRCR